VHFNAPGSAPSVLSYFLDWRPDYVMIVVIALIAYGYLTTKRSASRQGIKWPRRRDITFWVGMAAVVWATNGFPQARGFQLMWVWMAQELLILLIVPIIVMSAQPVALATAVYGPHNRLNRVLGTTVLKFFGSPLVSPVLVPVLSLLLVFGGLGTFSLSSVLAGGAVHLLLLLVGAMVALPLVNIDDRRTSLVVGLSLAVGVVELILDAFPGIALRFQTHMTLAHFAINRPSFSPIGIDDQHIAGDILWVVAEILDLPFLILAATRWIKADARDAAAIDAQLDARQHWAADGSAIEEPVIDRPWWLDEPDLQSRFRRPNPRTAGLRAPTASIGPGGEDQPPEADSPGQR